VSDVLDRAAGCLVGLAYGDALGVPYEAGVRPLDGTPHLLGGGLGNYEPGEWSDDTQMAICIAQAALDVGPADLPTEVGLDAVAERFEDWYAGRPADIGIQTARVLRDAELLTGGPAARLRAAAHALHERSGRTAGNGALMRTAPVAVALHGNAGAIASTARAVAELTHPDPLAGDSCVLWCLAIDEALRGGPVDPAAHLEALPAQRRDQWAAWIAEADGAPPSMFADNGFTVTALQAAWAGISYPPESDPGSPHSLRFGGNPGSERTFGASARRPAGSSRERSSLPRASYLRMIHAAISAGGDTDTVAAIAGALAGAGWGLAALRDDRIDRVHGWPDLTIDDLAELGRQLVRI
jgi:ADP-ribosylglycohydrolase